MITYMLGKASTGKFRFAIVETDEEWHEPEHGYIIQRSYGQVNPLQDYVNEGWAMFREMLETISLEVVLNLLNIKVEIKKDDKPKDTFVVKAEANDVPVNEKKEEKDMKVVNSEAEAGLNISHIDKNATAAKEHNYDDVHTN